MGVWPVLACGIILGALYFGEEEEIYERKQRYSQCGISGKIITSLTELSLPWTQTLEVLPLAGIFRETRSRMWTLSFITPRANSLVFCSYLL